MSHDQLMSLSGFPGGKLIIMYVYFPSGLQSRTLKKKKVDQEDIFILANLNDLSS